MRQWDIDKFIDVNKTFLRICVLNEDSKSVYWDIDAKSNNEIYLFCFNVNHEKQYFIFYIGTCYSIVSCSPLILIGAHFSSLAINQLDDLSLFKNMMKKRPCSEITAFKNSDPTLGFISYSLGYIPSTLGYISSTLGYISSISYGLYIQELSI